MDVEEEETHGLCSYLRDYMPQRLLLRQTFTRGRRSGSVSARTEREKSSVWFRGDDALVVEE
jgi:hypothetical protein